MTLGLLWYVRMPADSAPWIVRFDDPATLLPPVDYLVDFLPAALLFGIGLAVMVAPLTTALMQSVPVGNAGVASAVNNAISRIGPQLAGALIFVAISASFYAQLGTALRGSVPAGELREQVSPLNPPAPGTPDDVAAAAKAASTDAFRLAMLIAAGLCLAGAAVNAVGIRDERRRVSEHDAEVAGELKKLEVPVAVDLDRG